MAIFQHRPERTEENPENLSKDRWLQHQGLNLKPSIYIKQESRKYCSIW
jgi:hypothetical protein